MAAPGLGRGTEAALGRDRGHRGNSRLKKTTLKWSWGEIERGDCRVEPCGTGPHELTRPNIFGQLTSINNVGGLEPPW